MDWVEVETPGPGPKMLWPMAWSLLPLVGGLLLLLRDGCLLATSFLAMGIMLSLYGAFAFNFMGIILSVLRGLAFQFCAACFYFFSRV